MNILIKPASSLCNMKCKYCFYHDESKNRELYFKGIMNDDTVDNIIAKALEFSQNHINFAFQGGEPTLAGLDYFKKFVSKIKEKNTDNKKISYSIQTNGLLFNKEWATFLKENNFLVGISLDGTQQLHNKSRLDSKDNYTYQKVISAIKTLNNFHIEYNVLCVVTNQIANNIKDIYNNYKKMGIKYMQFIPCINPINSTETSRYTLTNDQYYYFLDNLFDLWYEDILKGNYYSIRYFDNLLTLYRDNIAEQCGLQGHCNIQFVIEGNGDIYPCDFYCLDEYFLGNINNISFKDIIYNPKTKKFITDSTIYNEECKNCFAYHICKSGCKRYQFNNKYIYCNTIKKIYSKLINKLPLILKKISTK